MRMFLTGVFCSIAGGTLMVLSYPYAYGNVTPTTTIPTPKTPVQTAATLQAPMKVIRGDASYYGAEHGFHGSCMANGEIYDKEAPTAAHRSLPLGTVVRVWYQSRSVIVEITDRGPYAEDEGGGLIESRVIDLSEGSARTLGLIRQGVGLVTIEILKQPEESQMYHHEHPECLRGSLARRSYLLSRTQ